MCKKIYTFLACLIFLSFSISFADTLKYELHPHMIGSAWITISSKKCDVTLRLAEPYCSDFAKLTRQNIGRHLTISYNGRVLVGANIQDEILSGSIGGGSYKTIQEAKAFIREIIPWIEERQIQVSFWPDPLEFTLQPGMLQSVSIEQKRFGYVILFQFLFRLSDAYHSMFADLTRENVGRQLIIHYHNGRVIASMDIPKEITDGAFSNGAFSTRREAEAFIREAMPDIGEIPVR